PAIARKRIVSPVTKLLHRDEAGQLLAGGRTGTHRLKQHRRNARQRRGCADRRTAPIAAPQIDPLWPFALVDRDEGRCPIAAHPDQGIGWSRWLGDLCYSEP